MARVAAIGGIVNGTGIAITERRPLGSTPTPAPSFSVQPTINDDGTPAVGETLTGNDGTIANGTVSARQWLRNGSAISGANGSSYVPTQAGDHAFRVTAAGPGGITPATSAARTVVSAPAPTPTPTPYTMLHDFDEVGTATSTTVALSQHAGSRKAQGAAGLLAIGNGTSALSIVSAIKTGVTTDLAPFDRLLMCFDLGEAGFNPLQVARADFHVGGTQYAAPGTTTGEFDRNAPWWRGKVWQSWDLNKLHQGANTSNPNIKSQGTAAKELRVRMPDAVFGRGTNAVLDAAILQPFSAFTPDFVFTLDDLFVRQHTNLLPLLIEYNIPVTIMECSGLVGTANRLTQSMIDAFRARGDAVCLDSGLTSNSLTSYGTLANAVATMQTRKAELVAKYGDELAASLMCYANGAIGMKAYGPSQANVYAFTGATITGNQITLPALAQAQSHVCRGMRAFTAAGIYLGAVTGNTFPGSGSATIMLDNAPGDATGQTIHFCGMVPNLTVTANGTNIVTVTGTDANKLFSGLHMIGFDCPEGVKINSLTVTSTTTADLVMSAEIGAGCVRADFVFLDGEWHPRNTVDALYAGGFRMGRYGAGGGGIVTPYGFDPRNLLCLPALSIVGSENPNTLLSTIATNAGHGRTQFSYIHDVQDAHMDSFWRVFVPGFAAQRDAGLHNPCTLPQSYLNIMAKGGFV